ncbi:MAG: hypothetical protein H6719_21810 [Sandaracinaceae bacterium]|nr:hypothetical protein [Sandaracinaceae bacterium]
MNTRSRHLVTLASLLALAGCAADAPDRPDIRPVTLHRDTVAPPLPVEDVVGRFDLLPIPGEPTGVAVEPDTGRRLILLSEGMIVDLESGETLWSGVPLQGGTAFSDIVALGGGRVAITSVSDGYLVDLATGEITPHFCYEPGWWDGEGQDPVQLSQAVAHDAQRGILYAQPRTLTAGGSGPVTESFVSAYDEASGADIAWWSIEDLGFVATGMEMLEPGREVGEARLLLAEGHTLHAFDGASGDLTPVGDLYGLDVVYISGLAIDREAGTLLVLDAGTRRVLEIRLDALGL